ncbi:hypothetical protein ACLOJK_009976 [Asimina triloba]
MQGRKGFSIENAIDKDITKRYHCREGRSRTFDREFDSLGKNRFHARWGGGIRTMDGQGFHSTGIRGSSTADSSEIIWAMAVGRWERWRAVSRQQAACFLRRYSEVAPMQI